MSEYFSYSLKTKDYLITIYPKMIIVFDSKLHYTIVFNFPNGIEVKNNELQQGLSSVTIFITTDDLIVKIHVGLTLEEAAVYAVESLMFEYFLNKSSGQTKGHETTGQQ